MIKKKSVAIFSAYYPPHIGGVERFTYCIAHEMAANGYDVNIVTSDTSSNANLADSDDSITLWRIPCWSIAKDRFPIIKPSFTNYQKYQSLLNADFQYYVVNTRYYPISLLGCHLARIKGTRPIVIDHSSGFLSQSPGPLGFLIRLYERIMTFIIKRDEPSFYSVSHKSADWLNELGIKARGIIPNSIDADYFLAGTSDKNWRLSYQVDGLMAVYASRLVSEKGVLTAIDAINTYNDSSDKKITLLIAGNGPLKKSVGKFESRFIHYVGILNSSDISSLLSQSDLFLFPSIYPEGLPTVLLEAGACSNVILTSDCGGARDIIPNDDYGIVLTDVSSNSFADALKRVSDNQFKLDTISNNIYQRVKNHFSWSKSAALLIEACNSANDN